MGNTTKGPQPGFVSFICLHKPALPRFSPLSGVVPRWASAAQPTVWGYVGKFCVSCFSLGGLVNNHTIHGMFRHKAPCRALFGSAAARNIIFNFLVRKNPAATPQLYFYSGDASGPPTAADLLVTLAARSVARRGTFRDWLWCLGVWLRRLCGKWRRNQVRVRFSTLCGGG